MGKHGKKQQRQAHNKSSRARNYLERDESDYGYGNEESLPFSNQSLSDQEVDDDDDEVTVENLNAGDDTSGIIPSKFDLYQQSVQSPKGDISYLQKFFLMYIGGRVPLHFQEDFCGTALLSTEWLRGDSRRTAVGIDLDDEALNWCVKNNLMKLDADIFSRLSLFHGNVLQPLESRLVKSQPLNLISDISLNDKGDVINIVPEESAAVPGPQAVDVYIKRNITLPARDIVCAFNYSCCCLHKRTELISYFKHVLEALSKKGGIFVMDLYGGTSSECELKLQRKFPNFTYTWEQEEFDIIQRKTRISLHFHLKKQQKKIRHAFSYSWRLWSLPEIKDCLEEAGFRSVHFWLRQMPDTDENRSTVGFGAGRDVKYEEVTSFQQQDAWNAYIVAVSN